MGIGNSCPDPFWCFWRIYHIGGNSCPNCGLYLFGGSVPIQGYSITGPTEDRD